MTPLTTRLPDDQFAALAAGYGDADAIATLAHGQLEQRRILLVAVAGSVPDNVADGELRERFDAAWELLASAERESRGLLTAPGGVFHHPYVGAWAARCLRDLPGYREGSVPGSVVAAEIGYLAALGAVAAVHGGRDAEIDAIVVDGGVTMPTLGRVVLDLPDGARVTLRVSGDGATAHRDGASVPCGWQAVRTLASAPRAVRIEDADPYRDSHQWPVTGRLTDGEAARWRDMFAGARRTIADDHPAYLAGLDAGLTLITPLVRPEGGNDVSAASRYAFGAIGTVLPDIAPMLALLLIHELQHVKLNALLDLEPLHDGSDTTLYYAPWRPDPRPLEALLHGAYAHLGVTDFWRRQRQAPDADGLAEARFTRWREQTARSIETIATSPALTPAGVRFAASMGATIEPWLKEPVSAAAVSAAHESAAGHLAAFESRR